MHLKMQRQSHLTSKDNIQSIFKLKMHVWILCPSELSVSWLLSLFLIVHLCVFAHLFPLLAMRDTKDALENVSLTLETLQEGTVKLQANLSLVRGSLSNALNDPVCTDIRSSEICRNIHSTLPNLEIAANYSSVLKLFLIFFSKILSPT